MTDCATNPAVEISGLAKTFTLHAQGGARIPVLSGVALKVAPGECLALAGPSGSGKSTLMRMIYGNYLCDQGAIRLRHDGDMVDLARAAPWTIFDIRRRTLGYVSQFLRVIPRVTALDIVTEPLTLRGEDREAARERGRALLTRLRVPETLWSLPPATFSGGEQQRINVARGFLAEYPILLLDEPTASLDAANRQTVVELILEARARGATLIGIFHDAEVRDAVATRRFDIGAARAAA